MREVRDGEIQAYIKFDVVNLVIISQIELEQMIAKF